MVADDSFGGRLRRERERRQIPLASICANTKIKVSLFEGLERNDVSKWPSGIFRKAFVRAYAEGIGLDADVVMREFLERFPDPACEGLPASEPLGAARGHALVASDSGIRLTLADADVAFNRGRILRTMGL